MCCKPCCNPASLSAPQSLGVNHILGACFVCSGLPSCQPREPRWPPLMRLGISPPILGTSLRFCGSDVKIIKKQPGLLGNAELSTCPWSVLSTLERSAELGVDEFSSQPQSWFCQQMWVKFLVSENSLASQSWQEALR